ncbi:MAG: cytochrome c [Saprospiraceae bacterium]|nr:cytochrome c [Saprospiraceae bacterium]
MRNIHILLTFTLFIFIVACGGSDKKSAETTSATPATETKSSEPASYDPTRGEGKFTAENVKIDPKLDTGMADAGEKIASVKCTSCHKMSAEKLVGPGWKGVTERKTAHWIMNFITNPDPMIDKDPELQAQLELCLVRMPNQSLADNDARHIVEFMRKNDGIK